MLSLLTSYAKPMKVAMLLNDDRATVICGDVRSVRQVTRWFDDLADDYYSGQGLGLHHASCDG